MYTNAFDWLRMIGATCVMLSHSFRWMKVPKPAWSLFFTDGGFGVIMFFAMTGFMIMPAYERAINRQQPSTAKTTPTIDNEHTNTQNHVLGWKGILCFYWNRCIRLYPALWFSFIIISVIDVVLIGENIFSLDYIKYAMKYCIFAQGGGVRF